MQIGDGARHCASPAFGERRDHGGAERLTSAKRPEAAVVRKQKCREVADTAARVLLVRGCRSERRLGGRAWSRSARRVPPFGAFADHALRSRYEWVDSSLAAVACVARLRFFSPRRRRTSGVRATSAERAASPAVSLGRREYLPLIRAIR
jgi:hypothetical protein